MRAIGATALYLFGSTARDEAGGKSDLDVFIDYDRDSRFSLVELVGIKQLLEGRLGVPVDITTRDSGPAPAQFDRTLGGADFLMEKLVRPALRAILEAIDGIETATYGKTIDDYHAEWLLRHGIQRGIEIISEAARRVPAQLLATQPDVPWTQIMTSPQSPGSASPPGRSGQRRPDLQADHARYMYFA